jgi:5-methylcytosine-specific restriction endonuclease McrA
MPAEIPRWRPQRPRTKQTKETAHYRSCDWKAKRQRILIRDAFTCRQCGKVIDGKRAHVDHIIPLEDGGTDDDANLQVLCDADHGRKTREEQRRRGYL